VSGVLKIHFLKIDLDQHGAWLGKTRHGDQGVVHLSSVSRRSPSAPTKSKCCDYEGGVWLDKIACLTQVGTRGKGDVLWPGNTVSQNLPKSWWDRTSYDRHEFLPQQSQVCRRRSETHL
jgi:hypothetical protein